MVVRLRLARHGTKNHPFYHVVAIRDKAARDARPIEKLGEYDPIPRPKKVTSYSATASSSDSTSGRVLSSGLEDQKVVMEKRIEWNANRISYWLGVGAQPSKTVARLLDKAGLIPEGKTYKGIYVPANTTQRPPSSNSKASTSAILEAAGVDTKGTSSIEDGATTAMRQGESLEGAKRSDPKREAMKSGGAEGSIDQAA